MHLPPNVPDPRGQFVESEFLQETQSFSDEQFIEHAYRVIFDREVDQAAYDSIMDRLTTGPLSRKGVLLSLCNSAEAVAKMAPNVELISVHVPKVAGAYFHTALKEIYEAGAVKSVYNGLSHTAVLPNERTRVLHGHFRADRFSRCCPNAKTVTWLRHPLRRLISLHAFYLSTPRVPTHDELYQQVVETKMPFEDFVELPLMQNAIARRFSTTSLEDFFFLGIYEHLAEDLRELGFRLGWSVKPVIKTVNATIMQDYTEHTNRILNDINLVKRVKKLNSDDFELYDRALDRRRQR